MPSVEQCGFPYLQSIAIVVARLVGLSVWQLKFAGSTFYPAAAVGEPHQSGNSLRAENHSALEAE